jgi:hypothetical protein
MVREGAGGIAAVVVLPLTVTLSSSNGRRGA